MCSCLQRRRCWPPRTIFSSLGIRWLDPIPPWGRTPPAHPWPWWLRPIVIAIWGVSRPSWTSFGVFTQALAPSGPQRILGAPAEDGVESDNTLQTTVLDLLASDLAVLEETTAATLGVPLDRSAAALRAGETNFADLVADAAFAAARSTAFNAGAPSPQVGILDAGSLTSDAVLPAGR